MTILGTPHLADKGGIEHGVLAHDAARVAGAAEQEFVATMVCGFTHGLLASGLTD